MAADATLPCLPVSDAVMTALRALPADARPMDALRTAVSVWGAVENPSWPPTPEQARALTASSPSALAAFARLRQGWSRSRRTRTLDLVAGFLYQLNGVQPEAEAPARSTPTSSSARSTASTPRRSRHG